MKALTLPSIFKAIDKFSGPVNKMTKSAEASMSRMARKMGKISKTALDISKKTALMGAAIIAPMVIFANEAVAFEEKMSNVSTLIDTQAESISDMGDKVLDLSKKIPVPIEELTESLYTVRSAGISASDQFDVLEQSAILAVAGISSSSEATDIMTSSLNAFASQGLTASETADILFKAVRFGGLTISELSQAFGSTAPIVQSAGVSLEDFSAATAALTTLGTPASQAQNQIRAAVTSLQKPTENMTKVFEKLGVTTEKQLIEKNGGLVAGFNAVNAAIEEMGINSANTWSSTEALAAVTSLTGSTNESYLKTLEAMTEGSNMLNEAYEKQLKTGKNQMQITKNNMQALSITLGTTLIPVISELVQSVSPILTSFSDWAKNNKSTVSTIMKLAASVAGLMFSISAISGVISVFSKAIQLSIYVSKGFNAVMKVTRMLTLWAGLNFNILTSGIQSSTKSTKIATIATRAWAIATKLAMGPIGWIIIGVGALAVGVYALTKAFSSQTTAQKLNSEVQKRALDNTVDQRVEVTLLFKALRKAEEGSKQYNDTLKKLEEIQPGIISKYDLQAKSLEKINQAEKELISNIMKRAETEARAELMTEKMKEAMTIEQEGPGLKEKFLEMWSYGELDANQLNQNKADQLRNEVDVLANQQVEADMNENVISPGRTQQKQLIERLDKKQETLTIDFKNLPPGVEVSGGGSAGITMPTVGNTRN